MKKEEADRRDVKIVENAIVHRYDFIPIFSYLKIET
jgi:hypothetical protein